MGHEILSLPETAREWPRAVAPVSAHRISSAMGRFRRAVEQQELQGDFVDKLVEQKIGEQAAPAVRRDAPRPITLFRLVAASRHGPWVRCWGGMGVPLSQSCAGGAPICGGLSAEEWVVSRAGSIGWAELSADYLK